MPPFDRWLNRQLHDLYDQVASEPLPDGLIDLIDRDAARIHVRTPARTTLKPPA